MSLPTYYPGKASSATDENNRNREIRKGSLTGGPGVAVSSTSNGSTVTVLPRPERRTAITIGGAVVVTEAVTYTDTPVQVTLEPPNTTEILGAVTGSMTAADGLLDLDSATPSITLTHPGRYLIHYRATCGYAESCATAQNLSDAVTRLRLSIGGTLRDETAVYGTHHAKLCATGLVRDVSGNVTLPALAVDISGMTSTSEALSSFAGAVSYQPTIASTIDSGATVDVSNSGATVDLNLTVTKVGSYNRWTGGKVTINGTFQVLVVMDDTGAPKIAETAPVEPSTASTTCAPTISLWVDRSDVEPAAGVYPFSAWNDDPELTLHEAQLHVIRLC